MIDTLNSVLNDVECNVACCYAGLKEANMTKLLEWVLGFGLFTGIWGSLVISNLRWQSNDVWKIIILPLPIILVILFGIYAFVVIMWRVYNFNNCEDAAKELTQQIEEAKKELMKKGFIFTDGS